MIQTPDPSPQEIAQATATIREGWSESETMSRRERVPPLLSDCDFATIEARAKAERQRLRGLRRGNGGSQFDHFHIAGGCESDQKRSQ